TIVNTTDLPQIAHVVVWTDWSFPALDFNIFLTGYDVQGINMYDIFARATIAPGAVSGTGGTSSNTTVPTNPTPGSQPAPNDPNPATGNYAGGNPLVPIRAVPEGGPAGSVPGTNLPYTFYDRYTFGVVPRTIDRRQPLPTVWAARFINGGTGAFNTNFKIWREGITIGACSGAGIAAL